MVTHTISVFNRFQFSTKVLYNSQEVQDEAIKAINTSYELQRVCKVKEAQKLGIEHL